MTRTRFYILILFSLLCCPALVGHAQKGTVVKVTVDRNKILIGEPIRLQLEADIPESDAIRFFLLDSIPHFEFLAKEKIDTVNTGNGTVLSQVIRITSFDSGHWVIPAFKLSATIATDTIPMDVVFSEFDPRQPYHDIKDIIEVGPEEEKKKNNWWYYAAAGAAVLLVAIYVLTRKKKPVIKIPEAPPDPYRNAMSKLEELQHSKPETKQYYSRLIDIFRVYLLGRKGIHSLQHTTDDLVVQLKETGLPKEQFDQLAQALRLGDFVKFAKYVPEQKDDTYVFETIKTAIISIEKINVTPEVEKAG